MHIDFAKSLLPNDKCDDSNIEKLDKLSGDEIQSIEK